MPGSTPSPRHAALFPEELPAFSIKFLTEPGDVVMDIFSGSNTTGVVAEEIERKWLAIEIDRDYAVLSAVRFMEAWPEAETRATIEAMEIGQVPEIRLTRAPRPEEAGMEQLLFDFSEEAP